MLSVPSKKQSLQDLIADSCTQKEQLRSFAQEIVAGLFAADPSGRDDLLDAFISEVVLSAADQRRRAQRRQHQQACVDAAKARGVQFGRQPAPLPDNFEEYYQAWRNGALSLRQAANACGMGRTAFHSAVMRREREEDRVQVN